MESLKKRACSTRVRDLIEISLLNRCRCIKFKMYKHRAKNNTILNKEAGKKLAERSRTNEK